MGKRRAISYEINMGSLCDPVTVSEAVNQRNENLVHPQVHLTQRNRKGLPHSHLAGPQQGDSDTGTQLLIW